MPHYLYSMANFGDLILDALKIADAADIVEIGAEYGEMSERLLAQAHALGGSFTSIDPAPRAEFLDWVAAHPDAHHVSEPSLLALTHVAAADAWIVDGDHNWFTVYHELVMIRAASTRAAKPLLVFLHDVSWPCARRDFYYAPEQIPEAYRHAHSFTAGASLDWEGLKPHRGLRGHGRLALAEHEGGPRNGVLTAVEDFIADSKAGGLPLCYAHVPAALGLGVIFDATAPWAEPLASHLMPWHENKLLAVLEENRLKNFLDAVELEDSAAQRRAA
jgi:hypothetical protein